MIVKISDKKLNNQGDIIKEMKEKGYYLIIVSDEFVSEEQSRLVFSRVTYFDLPKEQDQTWIF